MHYSGSRRDIVHQVCFLKQLLGKPTVQCVLALWEFLQPCKFKALKDKFYEINTHTTTQTTTCLQFFPAAPSWSEHYAKQQFEHQKNISSLLPILKVILLILLSDVGARM